MRYYDKSDYLAHYGILGMKWGVRRYQNADGSLTAAGRTRYNAGEKTPDVFSKALEPSIKTKNGKTSPAEKGLGSVKQIVDKTRDIVGKTRSSRNNMRERSVKQDISSMSNEDLQRYITRANLESSYARLKASESSNRVSNVVENALGLASDVLGIVTPVVSLVVLIRSL